MTLNEFKDWALNQGSVANPTSDPKSQYLGECVSLIQQYLNRVYGVAWRPRGHAKDWVSNPVSDKFDKVSGTPQKGDIIIYDSRFGGGFGHIAIALGNGQMLDQNGASNGKIRVGAIWPNYSAILRPKQGEDDMPAFNEGDRKNINDSLFGEDKGYWKDKIGKDYKQAVEQILGSTQFLSEQYINPGDVKNISDTLTPQDKGITGWLWKRWWYDVGSKQVNNSGTIDPEVKKALNVIKEKYND